MPFSKGDPNINRKGRPCNPDKAFQRVLDLLEDLQFHPAKELVRMYRTTKDEKVKVQILFKLMTYVEGKKADAKDPAVKKPESPEESLKNAEKQQELLKKLEAEAQKKAE